MGQRDGVSPIISGTARRQSLNEGDWMSSCSAPGPPWGSCTASGSGMTTRAPALPGKHLPHAGLLWALLVIAVNNNSPRARKSQVDLHFKAVYKEEIPEINVEINIMIFCGFKNDRCFIFLLFSLSVMVCTSNHKEILPQSTTN